MAVVHVCGEALIDFVPRKTAEGTAYLALPGGSPFNIAKAAALAGTGASFLGALSTDLFGDLLLDDLKAAGVDTRLAPRSTDPTTLAFVDTSHGDPRYAFFDRQSASVTMAPTAFGLTPAPGDMLCVGSISLISVPGGDNITRFALDMASDMMLVTDPNVRPNMVVARSDWEARLDAIFGAATVIKISTEDLDYLRPGLDRESFAAEMLARGVAMVVITGGAEGALAVTPTGRADMQPPRVAVTDTVGAGDTFMGNLLAGVQATGAGSKADVAALSTPALETILQRACWSAAINVTRLGCQPPTISETRAAIAAGKIV